MERNTERNGITATEYAELTGVSVDTLRKRFAKAYGTGFNRSAAFPAELQYGTDGAESGKKKEISVTIKKKRIAESPKVAELKTIPKEIPPIEESTEAYKDWKEYDPSDQTAEFILWWCVAFIHIGMVSWGLWSLFPNTTGVLMAICAALFIVLGLLILQRENSAGSSWLVIGMFFLLGCGEVWLHKQTACNSFNSNLSTDYTNSKEIICWAASCLFTGIVLTTSFAMRFRIKENQ